MLLSRGKDSFQSHKPAAREDRSPLDLLPVLADLVTLLSVPPQGGRVYGSCQLPAATPSAL